MCWITGKAFSAYILGWIRQCMVWLENWWQSGSEICLVVISYMFPPFHYTCPHVSPIVSPVYLSISHVSLGASPCFLFRSYSYWILSSIYVKIISVVVSSLCKYFECFHWNRKSSVKIVNNWLLHLIVNWKSQNSG